MASSSQQIVNAVCDIDNISKDAAGHTQNVSAATEQSASMEEIAASSQALAKMAEELQLIIQKFTI
jgi:methyl-accepting chemotaxis protein